MHGILSEMITNTISGVPYYDSGIVYPKALF